MSNPVVGNATPIPVAIWEQVHRYFNRDDLKWWAAAESRRAQPYARIRDWLAARHEVRVLTDDDSAGECYYLADHPDGLMVCLSWVGPWSYVWSTRDGLPCADVEIDRFLESQGFIYLGVDLLSSRVDYWGEEFAAPLYEYLFQSESDLPWVLYGSGPRRADDSGTTTYLDRSS